MKMLTVQILVLSCLLPVIICEEAITDPVDVLQINHLLLKNYHGKLNSKILKLFPNVEIFEIRNCNFTTVHDEFFHSIPKIRKLIVIDSFIRREDHDISSCCWKLKEIDFINAGFDMVPWHKMGHHWPLERLYLYKEIVTHLKTNFFENKHLKNLTIENANLENIEDSAFKGLINIEVLNLKNNKLKHINKNMFAPLTKLKVLNLRENLIEKLTTEQIPSLPELETIDLRGNKNLREIDLTDVKKLTPNLKEIKITSLVGIDLSKSGGVNFVHDSI